MKAINWNKDWLVFEDKDSFSLIWGISDKARKIDLPYDCMIYNKSYKDAIGGGNTGFRDGGSYVFCKEFECNDLNKNYILKFDGVMGLTQVYVNNMKVKSHIYGYTCFYASLNEYLEIGKNVIRVAVRNNDMPNSRWYPGCGIYRDVTLFASGKDNYILPDGIKVKTLSIDDDKAEIEVSIKSNLSKPSCLKIEMTDKDNKIVLSRKYSEIGEDFKEKVTIDNPVLWDDVTPNLYTIKAELDNTDSAETRFGIRTIKATHNDGLLINGREVKLRGACIHHDNGILGACSYYESEYRKVKLLKEAGFNAIRAAHNPSSSNLLRACDELGMYVMEEAFDMWSRCKTDYDYANYFDLCHKEDLKAMVENAYNHPSVIMYSLGNEIPEIGTRIGTKIKHELSSYVKSLDDTRVVLVSINGIFAVGDHIGELLSEALGIPLEEGKAASGNVNMFMSATRDHMPELVRSNTISKMLEEAEKDLDVVGYNYMSDRYEMDYLKYQDRVVVGSETYPPAIAKDWNIISNVKNVIGDFTWTGWDYIGEAGVGVVAYSFGEGGFGAGYPCQLAYCADIDITGFRRPQSYYREIAYGIRKDPYIVVENPYRYGEIPMMTPWAMGDALSSYTYDIEKGHKMVVKVYSPLGMVNLYQNGRLISSQESTYENNLITSFEIGYEVGELYAETIRNGNVIGRYSIKTVNSSRIEILEESTNTQDLIYIKVEALENGNLDYSRIDHVKVTVESSDAILLSSGSADPKTKYNYDEEEFDLFNGRGQIVLRKTNPNGKAIIKLESNIDGTITKEISF